MEVLFLFGLLGWFISLNYITCLDFDAMGDGSRFRQSFRSLSPQSH